MSLSRTKTAAKPDMKRRAQIIAWTVFGLGIFGTVVFLLSITQQGAASGEDLAYFISYTLLTFLGYKLTRLSAGALRILRFLAWVNVIIGGLMLLATLSTLPFILQILSADATRSAIGIILLLGFILMQLSPVMSLIILILTNPPAFRKLFR